jgi:hypothetical protein
MKAGAWKPGDDYPTVKDNAVGLLGFMAGQQPAAGVPTAIAPAIREKLAQMNDGKLTRFDIFKGPLKDNKGATVLAAGQTLTQEDLEGIKGVAGRPDCTHCLNFFVDGVVGEIPK